MSDDHRDRLLEPMRMWREWYQKSEKQWSEMLTDIMADEKFGKSFGHLFQEWLHAQHMISELIGQQLAAFNLPSRADILEVRDRLGEVEDGLGQLAAEITQLRRSLAGRAVVAAPETARPAVKRTRKPGKANSESVVSPGEDGGVKH
ncbi:MAG: hypothetical protein ACOY42_11070 [Pseudomonadota bacterium]|jgi:hypothetical protein